MTLIVDIIYLLALPVILLFAGISRLKGHPKREGIRERLGYGEKLEQHPSRVLLHAVSVGEVNAIQKLVALLDERGHDVVLCVTTDTGIKRAIELYGDKHIVTRYPIDFSFAVKRFIRRVKPSIIGLVELEIWPNFIRTANSSGIPVVIVNGRLSERSFSRYALIKTFLKSTFKKVIAIGVQTEIYAGRVRSLGGQNVTVEGTMKWDNATIEVSQQKADTLRNELGIDKDKLLIVAGSTAPEEHQLIKDACPDGVQLLCAPRRPEWFDEAAKTLAPCNRRSSDERIDTNMFLLDTIGELNLAYLLADIV
ncbi:MAG: glycosyltransferase N-terminal domain-containing protein, partial [Planctomycetota bacterium]|nr:glycosyltransferase N-terminal domain-containing protein [Planctomycetota bacterium]